MRPEVSVIIVNLNTKQLLEECLRSVYAEGSRDLEVIVIDNGSSDGSVEMVESKFPLTRLVRNKDNRGFAEPNNAGMRMASGKYLFLLNSDTSVRPGSIRTLAAFLERHPDVAACGPKLVYPDGRLQKSVKGFPSLWTHFCDMCLLDKAFSRSALFGRYDQSYLDYAKTQEVDHAMAAAFLVRKEVLGLVGLFDERFAIYYNDMDWCYRIKKAGWKIFYVHDAEVMHHLGKTVGLLNRDLKYFDELYNNTMLFYHKHFGRCAVPVYKLLLAAGFLPRSMYWCARSLFSRSEFVAHMRHFSERSLFLGLKFWAPLDVKSKGDNIFSSSRLN